MTTCLLYCFDIFWHTSSKCTWLCYRPGSPCLPEHPNHCVTLHGTQVEDLPTALRQDLLQLKLWKKNWNQTRKIWQTNGRPITWILLKGTDETIAFIILPPAKGLSCLTFLENQKLLSCLLWDLITNIFPRQAIILFYLFSLTSL